MPLNIVSQFHRKTIRHIVMKSLQPDPEFSGSFRFIVAQIMTQFSQPIVQKPEQPDALISGTVTAMRTISYPVKPVTNQTAFNVSITQNDSAVMLEVNHGNAMTLTPPYSRTKLLAAALMRCSTTSSKGGLNAVRPGGAQATAKTNRRKTNQKSYDHKN
jgi:hypothetical protein